MKSLSARFPVSLSSHFLIFVVAAISFIAQSVSAQVALNPDPIGVVEIPDPNLERAIREVLALPDEMSITQQEMLRLKKLKAKESQIENITGLGHAINLKSLVLPINNIQDITPLAGLINIEVLELRGNSITDLSPLANLTKLTDLNLGGLPIKDLTPLANLTLLEVLQLGHCRQIVDLTPLSNLIQLIRLGLNANQIVDVSPLANLTALEKLEITRNLIVDVSPLANLTALKELHIERNLIVDVSPLANLTQLTDLTIANNPITDFSPLFALNLQSVDVDIHKLQELASGDVEIPDPNLERAIREEMGLPSETPLTQLVMSRLTELNAKESQIADLTGLEHATYLKRLVLSTNEIQDTTPLARLINLDSLTLGGNPITDLSPLSHLTQLTYLKLASIPIKDLTPLSNLTQLKNLHLGNCQITSITPLSNLTQLNWLILPSNQIVDISPLANLIRLEELRLNYNRIVDVSPLANLTALKKLQIQNNQIFDFTPLQGLPLTEFIYDEVCLIPDPPIQDRIESRNFPSFSEGWGNSTTNLPHLSYEDRLALHDLHWHAPHFQLHFVPTPQGYQLRGALDRAIAKREERLAKNPNTIFLVQIRIRFARLHHQYPEDFSYWLRDEDGNLLQDWHESSGREQPDTYFLDFRLPGMQDIIVEQAIAVSKCGLYDGIMFDAWPDHGITLINKYTDPPTRYSTFEEEIAARLTIIQRIRANVPNDFLILVNHNQSKLPISAPYVNGNLMEIIIPNESGYTRDDIIEIETNLIWLEENLREPQINCLRGEGIPTEPPESPTNKRLMRLFTTMGLTLSDGYVTFLNGRRKHQFHFWYPFWDTDLGQPVSPTAQRYQDVEGLYIREFTNGWAVYNRTGEIQTISLPASATPVSDRGNNAASTTHLLPDLDGEIYLKSPSAADVNRDGRVDVLDLLQVANSLGQAAPDPNGDGVVNSLDLVFVAQQFSQ